ncbi:PREDICTED: uncharacterized protein LOC108779730 [Cyphomyrmex costatus]|uniref:uncharacterized protein LOC108779730 n=1 Tax=Cyphomyrmex costatus TaxID=456900 RepID=UPI0008522D0C|nr:PREDICTED: uncharacterized protein LOC108779730 [Cyphomyrmex costatus]
MKMRSNFYNSSLIYSVMWISSTYLLFILSLSATTTAEPAVDENGIGLTININKAYSHFNRIGKQQSRCEICCTQSSCRVYCDGNCECWNPCLAIACSPGYTCVSQPSTCPTPPCNLVATCRPTPTSD